MESPSPAFSSYYHFKRVATHLYKQRYFWWGALELDYFFLSHNYHRFFIGLCTFHFAEGIWLISVG